MSVSIPSSTLEKFTTFGDLLRFLRRRAGITQTELAMAVGYSDAQISRLEQNLRLPDIPTIGARFVPPLGLEDEPTAVTRLMDLAANVRREDAPGLGLCPYKGLNYFDEADADLFVGRELLTTKLTEGVLSLASSKSPDERRFLAVVGASGSGKSSLVRAGLVPSLRWNKASADWNIQVLTPTAHPLESLAMCLTEGDSSVLGAATLIDDLARDPRSLHLFARRGMTSANGSRTLLVVDQFEELFTLCRSEEERSAFIGNLLMAAFEVDGPTMVVITMRADFYAHCANYIQLREALAQQQEYIGAMSNEELRRAIEEPARRGRWEIEPGLVDQLLHDVGHEPGALPLLSHALLETWQRRRGRTMTLSGYASSGGVRGAIAETAEAVFSDQFSSEQKAIARRIFLRLTELGDETATSYTRRRAAFSELILKPEETATTQNVLKVLADARLIITSANSAEVAHEALIREWPTLRGWLEDNREGLRLHRHLTEAAQEWHQLNRIPDVLFRGARLTQLCEWASSHPDEMNELEREYLEASQALAEREVRERESQRQRELEATQKLVYAEQQRAEEQARAFGQLRKRSFFLAGALIVSILMVLIASFMGWQAQKASRFATSRELAAASISNLDVDPERSILLALEALSTANTLEAEDALHQSILASRVRKTIPAFDPSTPIDVVFSPNGQFLATASTDEVVKVWDLTSGLLLFTTSGHFAAYSPNGKNILTILADGTVKQWDAASGDEIQLAGSIDAGEEIVFNPDGSLLATVTDGNLPRTWDVQTGKELVKFAGHSEYVSHALFSPDGERLLTTSDDRTARIWDTATGEEILVLPDHPGWVWNAAFSPDGKRIATVSENVAIIWEAATGKKSFTLTGHMNTIHAVSFSPDGRLLATGGMDRKVILWDATTGRELFRLSGHTGAITSLAFSPDENLLATGSNDGTVRFWDLGENQEKLTLPGGSIHSIAFSPDGGQIAGSLGESAKIWDANSGREVQLLEDQGNWVNTLGFSPDGKFLATAGDDRHLEIWDAITGEELYRWPAHTGLVNALAFSPDGTRLVTASDDFKVKIWDVSTLSNRNATTGELVRTLEHAAKVTALAFSPDGTRLATGLDNGTVKIWDLTTLQELLVLRGHTDVVVSVTFSPDGSRIATASRDGTAKIWNPTTGKESFTLGTHTAAVMAIAFSPDGMRLGTASLDGSAKLWDAETGKELLTFPGDGTGLYSIAFNPDGSRLATSGEAGVRVYLMKIDDLIVLAHTRVTRSLTSDECQEYLHHLSAACARSSAIPTATPFSPATNGRICQVTSTGGLYDNYFNELIYQGIQESAQLYGWEANVLQSTSISDFEKNIKAFMGVDCKVVITVGTLIETMQFAAKTNPDQKFMTMDFVPDPPLENIWTQTYATDQAAFLAGYVAASVTKTGKVGVFGGIDIPQVTGFLDGFALGVDYYNHKNGKSIEVIGWDPKTRQGLFAGGFCCTTEGRQLARQLLDKGADIILPVAGQSVGWGAAAEIQEHGNAWVIGVDTDWTITNPEFAEIVLTSIEKHFDISVVEVAGAIADGIFEGGTHLGTLESGEVGISSFHNLDALISTKIKADLEQINLDIINGKIKTTP